MTASEHGRRLLAPDEVRRLPREQLLLFVRGEAPVRSARVDYRVERALGGRFEENPMHGGAPGCAGL